MADVVVIVVVNVAVDVVAVVFGFIAFGKVVMDQKEINSDIFRQLTANFNQLAP